MGINMWCFTALIFLVSVKAEPYNYLSKSIYERLQSTTPSPAPAEASTPESKGNKEIVLFLTPKQVETLQASGAVVRPFPEYQSEIAGLREKLQQNKPQYQIREKIQQNKPQYQIVEQNENQKQDSALDNYYKLLNIQEINEDLTNQPQTTEAAVEKTTTAPRNKYTKSRQQYKEKEYYSSTYVPKKASRTKTSNQNTNSEYVRFLPNYEKENVKMAPYQVVPLSPYQYVDVQVNVNTQANGEPQSNDEAGANDNAQGNENAQGNDNAQGNENAEENDEVQANDNARENAYTQREELRGYAYRQRDEEAQENEGSEENEDAQADDEAESEEAEEDQPSKQAQQKYARSRVHGRIPVPVLTQKSVSAQKYYRAQKVAGQPPRKQQVRPETSTPAAAEPAPVEEEEEAQFSRLLAPLYQHQAITESIARQKEELLNGELKIRRKLQDIQKAPRHSDQEYAAEIKNLAANLEKQNALAEIEAISKSPSAFLNQQKQNKQESKERRPTENVKQRVVSVSKPVLVRVQTPSGVQVQSQYPLPEEILRHIWEH